MGWALPVGARLEGIGVAEGDVDSGELLVLEEVADDPRKTHVCADGELADSVRVRVLSHVALYVGLELGVLSLERDQPAALDAHQDGLGQQSVLCREPVPHLLGGNYAID